MRKLFIAAVTVSTLSGCVAPMSEQLQQLNASAACCNEPAQLKTAGTLGADVAAALRPETPVAMINGQRSPALRYLVPSDLAGRQLVVRAAPRDQGTFHRSEGMAFVPVAVAFLGADGGPIAAAADSGLEAGPSESMMYSYAVWRKVTVPAGAASAVFYSDPALYGTSQTFAYRFGATTAAAGVPLFMSANAKAAYKVYGEFSVKVR